MRNPTTSQLHELALTSRAHRQPRHDNYPTGFMDGIDTGQRIARNAWFWRGFLAGAIVAAALVGLLFQEGILR